MISKIELEKPFKYRRLRANFLGRDRHRHKENNGLVQSVAEYKTTKNRGGIKGVYHMQ